MHRVPRYFSQSTRRDTCANCTRSVRWPRKFGSPEEICSRIPSSFLSREYLREYTNLPFPFQTISEPFVNLFVPLPVRTSRRRSRKILHESELDGTFRRVGSSIFDETEGGRREEENNLKVAIAGALKNRPGAGGINLDLRYRERERERESARRARKIPRLFEEEVDSARGSSCGMFQR